LGQAKAYITYETDFDPYSGPISVVDSERGKAFRRDVRDLLSLENAGVWAVQRALRNTNSEVRLNGLVAAQQFGARASSLVPTLVENLSKETDLKAEVIATLREIGPAAKPAVPALLEIIKSDPRERVVLLAKDTLREILK
jgi:hypothetical protein